MNTITEGFTLEERVEMLRERCDNYIGALMGGRVDDEADRTEGDALCIIHNYLRSPLAAGITNDGIREIAALITYVTSGHAVSDLHNTTPNGGLM